jgi:hypothetical protein
MASGKDSSPEMMSQLEIGGGKRISQHLSGGWNIAIVSAHFALTHESS